MKAKTVVWTVAAATVALLLLLSFAARPLRHGKTRGLRIHSVNSVRSVTFVLTNTNPPAPGASLPYR